MRRQESLDAPRVPEHDALTPKTKTQRALAKDAEVTVHYFEDKDKKIADRIMVWGASSSSSKGAAGNRKPPKPKS